DLVRAGTFRDTEPLLQIGGLSSSTKSAWVTLEIQWNSIANAPVAARYEVGINEERFAVCTSRPDQRNAAEIEELNFLHPVLRGSLDNYQGESLEKSSEGYRTDLERFIRSRNEPVQWDREIFRPLPFTSYTGALPMLGTALLFPSLDLSLHGYSDVNAYNLRQMTRCLSQALVGPAEKLRDGLRQLLYLGPLREIPTRNHQPERS